MTFPICHPALLGLLLPAVACAASEPAALADTAAAIDQYRKGTLIIQAAPGATVRVEQTRHEFWFGAALASQAFNGMMPAADAARYKDVFLANFNAAVTENAVKWLAMEPRQGEVNYATVNAILAWTDAHHLPLRGHNIYWGIDKFVQDWVKAMDNPTLLRTLEARGRDIAKSYRGRFAEYDLNNEMVHGNYYATRLGPGITKEMAGWVKQEDPGARLFLNDYDILTGKRLDDYVAQIRELLSEGVPIAGIGVQGHLHAETFDRAALRHALDVLAQFNLPIRVTEFNLPGQRSRFYAQPAAAVPLTPAEEETRARDIADYYRICFSHPAVAGILMWGFWEGANWIPASSLYRRDWSPTPSAEAYHDLVFKEWWTRWEGRADANGRCEVRAFFGTHVVSTGDKRVTVQLTKTAGQAAVDLR